MPSRTFGSVITVSFYARWEKWNNWSRIVDFGNGLRLDNIIIANDLDGGDLFTEYFVGNVKRASTKYLNSLEL